MSWFKENDVEYVNCSPPILDSDAELKAGLFEQTDAGSKYQRVVTQLSWLATIAREGALFRRHRAKESLDAGVVVPESGLEPPTY